MVVRSLVVLCFCAQVFTGGAQPALCQEDAGRIWRVADVEDGAAIGRASRHNTRGIARLGRKEWKDAEKEFREFIRMAPGAPAGTLNLALALDAQGKKEEAAKLLGEGAKRWPKNATILALRGHILWETGSREEAIAAYRGSADLARDPQVLYALARRLSFLGRHGEAEPFLRLLVGEGGISRAALLALGEELLLSGKAEEAVSAYKRCLQGAGRHGKELSEYLRTGEAFLKEGDRDKGLQQLRFFSNVYRTLELVRHQERILGRQSFCAPSHDLGAVPSSYPSPRTRPRFFYRDDLFEEQGMLQMGWEGGCLLDLGEQGEGVVLLGREEGSVFDFSGGRLVERGRFDAKGTACLSGDMDRDGDGDILVIGPQESSLVENKAGRWEKKEIKGLPQGRLKGGTEGALLDYDGDGDLDIMLAAPSLLLYRNGGDWSFQDYTDKAGVTGIEAEQGLLVADMDNDGDTDLYLLREKGPNRLLVGTSFARFEDLTELLGSASVGKGKASLTDLDLDGDLDLCTQRDEGDLLIALNTGDGLLKRYGAVRCDPAGGIRSLGILDLDGDSQMDILCLGAQEPAFLMGNRDLRFEDRTRQMCRDLPKGDYRRVLVLDAGRDGDPDLLFMRQGRSPYLLENQTTGTGEWVHAAVSGTMDNREGFGAKMDIYAGTLRYRHCFAASTAAAGWTGPSFSIGLGPWSRLDWIKVSWPNGLWDEQEDLASTRPIQIEQTVRMMGSCPFLYAWNGDRFFFAGEILVTSPLGLPLTVDRYSFLKGDEYLDVEGLKPVEGRYVLKLTNELREVAYIDRVELVAVDHATGVRAIGSEKFQLAPYEPFRVYGVRNTIRPRSARDEQGRDVTPHLMERDGNYPQPSGTTPYPSLGSEYAIELDFGNLGDAQVLLFLHGAFKWFEAGSFMATQGFSVTPRPPHLQIQDPEGSWITVIENMGMPGGQPKTIAVDLTGHFLNKDHRLRIVTNISGYWDQAFACVDFDPSTRILERLPPVGGQLHHRGHSRSHRRNDRPIEPLVFDYAHVEPGAPFRPIPGAYTRYGDILPLLLETDDRYVIMNSGDEITLMFDASALGTPLPGRERSFFFYSSGWSKDGSVFTAFSDAVEPLPFRGMSGYPYGPGESYPTDASHVGYRADWNTRYVVP
jgi:tetratricopeptide (TPR) repeat protein